MKIIRHLDDLLGLAGLGLIIYSGFLIHPAAGFASTGLAIWGCLFVFARSHKKPTSKKS